jgi:hypothetical protein
MLEVPRALTELSMHEELPSSQQTEVGYFFHDAVNSGGSRSKPFLFIY